MEPGASKPAATSGGVQAGTPATDVGGGHLTVRGPSQETPKGDPARTTHPADGASSPPRLYDGEA